MGLNFRHKLLVCMVLSAKEWPGKKLLERWMTYVTYASARNVSHL